MWKEKKIEIERYSERKRNKRKKKNETYNKIDLAWFLWLINLRGLFNA